VSEASDKRIDRRWLVACLLIALVLRCLVIQIRADELSHDRDAYLGIAQGVAAGRGLCSPGSTTPTAFRPPLYPLMLGGLLIAVPIGIAVAFINGLFGVATVWATHGIGRRLGLGRASLIAALLVAVDPLLLQYTSQPMTETACAGLVALLLLAMLSEEWQVSRREWVGGALFGLLVLCRPTFWPLAGLMVALWGLIRWRGDCVAAKDIPANILSPRGLPWRTIVGTMLVVAPWMIRNQLVVGVPLLTTTHGGYTLLLANNPVFWDEVVDQPWGTVWQGESLTRWQSRLDERLMRELGPQASESERDARLNRLGREYIAAQPRRFARAAWHRVRSLWSTVPLGDASADAPRWVIEAVGWYYSALLLAFVAGMGIVVRRAERDRWWPLFALVLTVQAVHLVYWTNARMRAPLTPLISLFAAALLAPCGRSKSDPVSATVSELAEQEDSSLRSDELA